MLKNNKYYYKGYDIYNNEFGDERLYDVFNPFGYNIESSKRRYKDNDFLASKTKGNNQKNMSNVPKR